jgi:acetyl-CoA carboxylase carboxyl transferase subunit alpha
MWTDPNKKQQAAAALRYTASDALRLGCVDDVLSEPAGGTQTDPAAAIALVDERLRIHFGELMKMSETERLEQRYRKFRNIAQFYTSD